MEKLGILLATDEYPGCAKGLLQAAAEAGVEANCFLTDSGVRVLMDPEFRERVSASGSAVTVCEHSWERYDLGEPLPEYNFASQYQNAAMVGWADKVVVL
jgi:hypothetical protein